MRDGVEAMAARLAAAALMIASVLAAAAASGTAQAYSGAQAEAQSDPIADPYSFPTISLCCKHKKYKKRRHHPGGGSPYPPYPPNGGYPNGGYPNGDYPRGSVRVSCGHPTPYALGSIAEALDRLGHKGRILVRPGAPCDITGLVIDRAVHIESDDYDYGARAELRSGGACAIVAPGYPNSTVLLRGIDVDGCFTQEGGRLELIEVNLASRAYGDAIRVNRGTLSTVDTTVRARGTAINARNGAIVSLTGGAFASGARAEHALRLEVDRATLQNTLIKGGAVGLHVALLGRYPVALTGVQVVRGDAGEAKIGVLVAGFEPGDDLPTLPGLPGAAFSFEGGTISGFADGLVFGPGTRGLAKRVNIGGPVHGIVVGAAAEVELHENRLARVRGIGIDLAAGARGSASFNEIDCPDGECVCYAKHCTSRPDRDFGHGAFRMSGTRCRD